MANRPPKRGDKPKRSSGSGPKGRPSRSPGRGPAPRAASQRSGPQRSGPPRESRDRERGLGGTQVEGRQAVRELLLAGTRKVREVLVASELDHSDVIDDIVELANDLRVPVREVSRGRLDAASRTEAAQGVLARAGELEDHDLDDLCRAGETAPFLVALDGVTDPGNLGALLRSAECAGVTGVVLPKHRAVHVTPTVTKAAAGAVEHVPMALVGGLPSAISRMSKLGVLIVGLDAGGTRSIHELQVSDGPVCLVLGAEGRGLSRLVRERCDVVASIPLRGRLSSLNVSVAGALGCYEIVRQRS